MRPDTGADTGTGVVEALGSDEQGTLVPYAGVVPYSKEHSCTGAPWLFTVAPSVAVLC